MKKIFNLLSLAIVLSLFASCQEKMQTCHGKVKRMTDTTIVATVDKYEILFDTRDASFLNGAVLLGDSAVFNYVGDLRKKEVKAMMVNLIPPKPHYIKPGYDPAKELKTAPISEGEKEQLDAFVKEAKKHGH